MRDDGREQGDIILRWLFQILLILGTIGLLAYEVLSIFVTSLSLDDNAREVARAARDAYRAEQSLDRAEQTAQEVADLHGVVVVGVDEEDGELAVRLEKEAPTLVVHRIGPMEDLAVATQTSRVRVQP